MPATHRDKIMHVRLEIGDQVLMDSDNHPEMPYEGVRNSSLALSVPQVEEATRIFSELAEGGAVVMPMQETFWAKSFGMVNDRFGVPWLINGAPQSPRGNMLGHADAESRPVAVRDAGGVRVKPGEAQAPELPLPARSRNAVIAP